MWDWQKWKYENRDKIKHIVGYEEKFVDEILSQIPEISPDDVIAQYPFKDNKSGNRYIDFMIINKSKGYKLPIELDGYAKINNKGYEKFNDFLERQNDLIQQFGVVLRYTNKKAFQQQQQVIHEIRKALQVQTNHQVTEQSKQKQIQSLIAEYEAKIADYEKQQTTNNSLNNSDVSNELSQVRKGLNLFKQNHLQELQNVQKELSEMKGRQTQELGSVKNEIKKQIYIGVGLVASIALGAVVYIKSTSQSVENIPITQQVSSSYLSSDVQADQNSTSSANHIQSIQASMYIGQNRIVCGKVAQLKEFSKGVYLNFDQPYPKATFTVVIWNNNSHISKQLRNVENNTLCIQGKIEEYRGKPQMVLNSLQQII
ncbi:OmpH family outer membrane protein [Acinetobacter indicus]|uniref:OmpH family outer membrane protein n=1 Tax=Acinetobacter indicus TaxID=756892 RepID=UPI000CEC8E5C|nr:OmpH family outer membrane protein [Acinetobacter indicus]